MDFFRLILWSLFDLILTRRFARLQTMYDSCLLVIKEEWN